MEEEIKLKVGELTERSDFGRGIVRISARDMKRIAINEGDVVEIEGKRKTAAIAVRAYPADVGLDIIRMDGLERRNCGAGIGEAVKIKKAEVKEAKNVTIAPARKGIIIHMGGNLLKQNLLMRPVLVGDIIIPNPIVQNRRQQSTFFEQFFGMDFGDFLFTPFGEEKFVVVNSDPKGIVRITRATDVELLPQATSPLEEEKIPQVTYEDLGGLHDEIQKVREMIELPLKHPELFERLGIEPPKGILLHGPPGTGKTLLAKAVANESGARFLLINGPEVMSKFYGESEENLRKVFEQAEKNAPSIIFLDEIDSIAPKREEVKGEVEKRVVSQLLTLMDGLKNRGKVIVIGATNIPNSLDPALRRPGRFDREIELGVPNKDGRYEILQIHTRGMPLTKNVDLEKIAEITYGYVGADISALCKEAAMHTLRRLLPDLGAMKEDKQISQDMLKKLIVTKDDFDYALKMVEPSAMREVLIEVPKVKWSDIGGLEGVKGSLKESVEWPLKHPQSFKRLGIRPPTGILLFGPPGCGKTMLAKAVANESGANFISVKGPELLSMWVGESEKHVRDVFRRAKQVAPSIIFFDEVDALVPRRGFGSDSHVTERVVSQLLAEISGLEELHDVVVIAASVTGETPILVKDKEGEIKLVTIGDFVDQFYEKAEEGIEKPIKEYKCLGFDNLSTKTPNGSRFGSSAFKDIRGVFRHKVEEIYEIEFLGGKIRTTGNHSVFVRTNNGIKAKPVSQLKPGEYLVDLPYKVNRTNRGLREVRSHNFKDKIELDIPIFDEDEVLQEKYAFALNSDIPQSQIATQLGISQPTVSLWQRGISSPRALSKKYFKHTLPEWVTVTPDLMRLFGYYTAEGYARKEIDFCFNTNEQFLIEDLKNLMKTNFGLEPDAIKINGKAINIVYNSKPLAKLFIRHCGKGAHKKHVPPALFEAPREYFLEFLKGYVAGDGYEDKHGRIEVTSVSKQLILELNWLCRMHGIKSYIHKFVAKEGRRIKNGSPLKAVEAYRLGIGKHNNPFNTLNTFSRSKRAVIKNIKKLPYSGYVYDLCGCDNEAFFGGESPILLHNTNRPDIIDPALLRPGRLDRQILVPTPDEKSRLEVFKVHTAGMPLTKDVDVKQLAAQADGYSGADIEALCREAAMNAMRKNIETSEVTRKDFAEALKDVKPSVNEEMNAFYESVLKKRKTQKMEEEIMYTG